MSRWAVPTQSRTVPPRVGCTGSGRGGCRGTLFLARASFWSYKVRAEGSVSALRASAMSRTLSSASRRLSEVGALPARPAQLRCSRSRCLPISCGVALVLIPNSA